MAIQQIVPIFITLQGDGSSTAFTFALKNLYQAGFNGSVPAGGGFTVVPSSIVANNPPVPVTSATVDANGNITITLTTALGAGVNATFEIDLVYNSGAATSASPTQTSNVTLVGTSTVTISGTVSDNITQVLGSAISATNTLFDQITDGTNPMGVMTNFGTTPGAVKALNTNASLFSGTTALTNTGGALNANITNTVTVSGTVAVTQSTSPWVTQDKASGAIASGVGTATGFAIGNAGLYSTTQPAPTNGQAVESQLDQSGNLLTIGGVQTKTGTAWTTATTINTLQFPTGTATVGAPIGASAILIQLDQTPQSLVVRSRSKVHTTDQIGSAFLRSIAQPPDFATLTNPYTFVPSTNQPYLVLLQGFQQIRLNLTSTITGTGSVTPFWSVLPYSISTPSSLILDRQRYSSCRRHARPTAVTAYGTTPAAANVEGVNAFVTNTVAENSTQVAATNLGTPQTFGTAPTGVVIGTSSDIYVSGTRARSNQTTTAAGVQDVISSDRWALRTPQPTVHLFALQTTPQLSRLPQRLGSAPTGTAVMGVNAFVTNAVTVSGTVSITANSSV